MTQSTLFGQVANECVFFWIILSNLPPKATPTGSSMTGVKGRSGGWRPGAGRKPGATQVKKKSKSVGIKKATKTGVPTVPVAHGNKLTAFFSKKQVAGGEVEVRAAAFPKPASLMRVCPPTAALLPMALSWFENNPSSYVFYLCAPQ